VKPYYQDDMVTLHHGDSLAVLREMPDQSVNCAVTSPPYFGLRDYGVEGQYGLEASPAEYVETMRALFAEVRRVLADDGTLWLNIGDSYSASPPGKTEQPMGRSTLHGKARAGKLRESQRLGGVDKTKFLPQKNLMGIPWRVAFALQDDGWVLRNDIIWSKPNAMPESVTDRMSTRHEHLFMLSKSRSYWFDLDPIREAPSERKVQPSDFTKASEPWGHGTGLALHTGTRLPHDAGRNPGDVWTVPTQPFSAAHFAVMPKMLAERAILAGCKPGGTVLDPFSGSGTTGLAATKHGRKYVGIDLSSDYLDLSLRTRFVDTPLDFGSAS
jgi:DNA modification methylase